MAIGTITTIPFTWWEGPEDGITDSGQFWARAVIRCAFADHVTLMRELKGGFKRDADDTWILPYPYPWEEKAIVSSCTAKPYLSSTGENATYGGNDYPYSLVTVNWNIRKASFEDDAVKSHSSQFTSSTESVMTPVDPQQSPIFYDTGARISRDMLPNSIMSNWQWSLTIYDVQTVSNNTRTMAGQVNSVAIASKYIPAQIAAAFTLPAETLLYNGANMSETVSSDGEDRWNLTLMFVYKSLPDDKDGDPSGWNHTLIPARTKPSKMYTDQGTTTRYKPYTTANLNDLLGDYL